jgi:hypothetical protein
MGSNGEVQRALERRQPVPSIEKSAPIDGVAVLRVRHGPGYDDSAFGGETRLMKLADAIETAEALEKGVYGCAFGDESVEVEIGPHLKALCGDDKDGFAVRITVRFAGEHGVQICWQVQTVDWTHTPDEEVDVAAIIAKQLMNESCGADAIDDDGDAAQARFGGEFEGLFDEKGCKFREVFEFRFRCYE